jgi:hypothetical protein
MYRHSCTYHRYRITAIYKSKHSIQVILQLINELIMTQLYWKNPFWLVSSRNRNLIVKIDRQSEIRASFKPDFGHLSFCVQTFICTLQQQVTLKLNIKHIICFVLFNIQNTTTSYTRQHVTIQVFWDVTLYHRVAGS